MSEIIGNSFTNSLVLLFIGAVLSAVVTWLFASRAAVLQLAKDNLAKAERQAEVIAEGHTKLEARVAELTERLSLVSAQVVPFSTAFQQILVAQLTHAHTPELDALMAKIGPPITLTEDEEREMYRLLTERQSDMGDEITQEEREAALILPYVMRRARAEQAQLAMAESVRLQMVGVTAMVAVPLSALKQVLPAPAVVP
jgi:hypothetical protein